MILERSGLNPREAAAPCIPDQMRRDDQASPIGREFEVGLGRDLQELENRLVENDPRAISDALQTLRHSASMNDVPNTVITHRIPKNPANDTAVQRRREAPSATAGWAAPSAFLRAAVLETDRNRPALRCLGPWRASQFARRAASSNTSIFEGIRSSLLVLAKSNSTVIAEPMIPLVNERLVDLLKEGQSAVIPPPYV